MDTCDVVIAGGGPAGSACAWRLRQAGLDAILVDGAAFPRDKVCAGWITPQVLAALALDPDEYRRTGRIIQPITGFRVGLIGAAGDVLIDYDRAVSYGIRRCEFDHHLLGRAQARTRLGAPVVRIRRERDRWIVNEAIEAPMLVGAGGHFCPVARMLNPRPDRDEHAIVIAQEAEFPIKEDGFATSPTIPELHFCRDLKGYGWCFRKEGFLNVGLGRLERRSVPAATAEFVEFLVAKGTVPRSMRCRWRGHAYRIANAGRRIVDEGVLLVGDAAGLACAASGEGIRPAIESGLMAAATVIEARGCYTRDRLDPYASDLRARFGGSNAGAWSRMIPAGVNAWVARGLLRRPAFVRHVVLDRWFLRAHEPPLRLNRGAAAHVRDADSIVSPTAAA